MRVPHPPYQKVKGYLTEHRLTYKDVANLLGCEIATVSNKINGSSDFTLAECKMLEKEFGIPLSFYA